MDQDAIRLKDVCVTYKYKEQSKESGIFKGRLTTKYNQVLDHVNLTVKKGEILGIVGINGSGKSTILSIMAKIMEPDSGNVEVFGKVASILELGMGRSLTLTAS